MRPVILKYPCGHGSRNQRLAYGTSLNVTSFPTRSGPEALAAKAPNISEKLSSLRSMSGNIVRWRSTLKHKNHASLNFRSIFQYFWVTMRPVIQNILADTAVATRASPMQRHSTSPDLRTRSGHLGSATWAPNISENPSALRSMSGNIVRWRSTVKLEILIKIKFPQFSA